MSLENFLRLQQFASQPLAVRCPTLLGEARFVSKWMSSNHHVLVVPLFVMKGKLEVEHLSVPNLAGLDTQLHVVA